ncbi:ATP synthase membrane subunit K, mitochondrial-like [Zophobas morio]|uniref:ATP synthase membrane subunit K, mitochondrial-like n=1 Tax=Zophobas morio TaxID=2755281 RepID=UPI00308365B4
MAGGSEAAEEAKLSGLSKIFNAQTTRGRANVAMATYASVGLLIAYFALRPKKSKK